MMLSDARVLSLLIVTELLSKSPRDPGVLRRRPRTSALRQIVALARRKAPWRLSLGVVAGVAHRLASFPPAAALTIATIPALSASGRAGQAATTAARSASRPGEVRKASWGTISAPEWQREWHAPGGAFSQVLVFSGGCGFAASVP